MVFTNLCHKSVSATRTTGFFRILFPSARLLSTDKRNDHYDIIITGGGMVGSAMAAALGHNPAFGGKKILLLESGPRTIVEKVPEKFSSRVCALSNATKSLLSSFGAWDNILRHQEVKYMRVWDSCSDVGITFDCDKLPPQASELAYIAENDLIVSAIMKQLQKSKVDIRFNSKVKSYNLNQGSKESELPLVQLDNGEVLSSDLLIGADGMNSMLRKSSNISTIGWSYHQKAVVATVKLTGCLENNTAWQRFLPTGPIALLPLSNEFSCLIWTTTDEHSAELLTTTPESFVASVNSAFNSDYNLSSSMAQLGAAAENLLVNVGLGVKSPKQFPPKVVEFDDESRKSFPLGLIHSTNYVSNRVALIGDAAHRVHPLSGQGVNLGFGDVTCLVEVLEETVLRGGDIGCVKNLTTYETQRQRRVLPMMATIDVLGRIYGNEIPPLVALRSLGCQIASSIPFIKEKMIQFAAN